MRAIGQAPMAPILAVKYQRPMEGRLPRSHTLDWQRSDDSGDGLAILLFRFCEPGLRKLRQSHHFGLIINISVSLQE